MISTITSSGSRQSRGWSRFNSPYGKTTAKGKYSGRDFNPDKAGGSIQNLNWKDIKINQAGVDKVKLYTKRFGELEDNKLMIGRLEPILTGELEATDIDKRFYTHEIKELERYRKLERAEIRNR